MRTLRATTANPVAVHVPFLRQTILMPRFGTLTFSIEAVNKWSQVERTVDRMLYCAGGNKSQQPHIQRLPLLDWFLWSSEEEEKKRGYCWFRRFKTHVARPAPTSAGDPTVSITNARPPPWVISDHSIPGYSGDEIVLNPINVLSGRAQNDTCRQDLLGRKRLTTNPSGRTLIPINSIFTCAFIWKWKVWSYLRARSTLDNGIQSMRPR